MTVRDMVKKLVSEDIVVEKEHIHGEPIWYNWDVEKVYEGRTSVLVYYKNALYGYSAFESLDKKHWDV